MHRYEELERRYYRRLALKWGLTLTAIALVGGGGYYLYSIGKLGHLSQLEGKLTSHQKSGTLKPVIEIKQVKIEHSKVASLPPPPAVNETTPSPTPKSLSPTPKPKVTEKTISPAAPVPASENSSENNGSIPVLTFQLPKEPPRLILSPPIEQAKAPKPVRREGELVHRVITAPLQAVTLRKKPVSPTTETSSAPLPGKIVEKKLNVSDLIQSYNENPNYDTAILIAQTFLREGNLYLAKIWALKANNINVQRPESWIIFAKVLLRKGYREDAIKVLKTYIEDYGYNDKVDQLLQQIKGGE